MVSEKPAQEVVASHTTAQPETELVSSSINRHLTLPTFQHNMVGVSTHCIIYFKIAVCRVLLCLMSFQVQRRGKIIPTSLRVKISWAQEYLTWMNWEAMGKI